MANTNTDLTEEDAADLQFPKGESLFFKLFPASCCKFKYFRERPDFLNSIL